MGNVTAVVALSRPEWVRRFAYWAMLCEHELDTLSAMGIAETQFDSACGLEPETAAEMYSGIRADLPARRRDDPGKGQSVGQDRRLSARNVRRDAGGSAEHAVR